MKKKIFAIAMVLMLLLVTVPIQAVTTETATTTAAGYNDLLFSNGYRGFCLDKDLDIAYGGDTFVIGDTTKAKNNLTGEDISQYLKILFVDYFEELFEADGNGGFQVKSAATIQAYVYAFSDRDSSWWNYDPIKGVVEKYNDGRRIDDHGETIQVGNKYVTFDFVSMTTTRRDIEQQDFFGYKLTVSDVPPVHVHNFSEEWEHDEDGHWHECECEEKSEDLPHNGGTATCVEPATCDDCSEPYGDKDPDNHVGDTEIRNYVEPTEDEDGYTGDTYCKSCDTLIEPGEPIKATPKAVPTNEDEGELVVQSNDPTPDETEPEETTVEENSTEAVSEETTVEEATTEAVSEETPTEEAPTEAVSEEDTTEETPTEAVSEEDTTEETPTEAVSEEDTTKEAPTEAVSEEDTTTDKHFSLLDILQKLDFPKPSNDTTKKSTEVEPETEVAKSGVAEASDNEKNVPLTGDNSDLILWSTILLIGVAGICVSKKKTHKKVRG